MTLSITADYLTSQGCPEPYLRRIAGAGFSHVHWAYHFNTDFTYSRYEVDRIEAWLKEYGHAVYGNACIRAQKNRSERLACKHSTR